MWSTDERSLKGSSGGQSSSRGVQAVAEREQRTRVGDSGGVGEVAKEGDRGASD
jgi:hypothetical protein